MSDPFSDALRHALSKRQASDLLRKRRLITPIDAVHVEIDGRPFTNFASNNYLGLTHHPKIVAAVHNANTHLGLGSGASALITGHTPAHAAAEASIAQWKSAQAAVLLPSGYQATHAAIQTFAALAKTSPNGVRFLIDKLTHASLIDAVRGSDQPFRLFPHNNLSKLSRLLSESPAGQLQIVVTESIFSMDGDAADLAGLAQLKEKHPFALLLDEAHASGVYGPSGAGYAAEVNLSNIVDVSIVTLSKAIGAAGGAVCATQQFCDALVNFGRAYIYSTAVPPAVGAAASAAIEVMRDEPERQQRVRELATRVRRALLPLGVTPDDSPIIPIILGEAAKALAAAKSLEDEGLLVIAVRPPTVAHGSSRLRITLSCEHSDAEVSALIAAVETAARPA